MSRILTATPSKKNESVEFYDISKKIISNFKQLNAECLVCIGGDGTLSTAQKLSDDDFMFCDYLLISKLISKDFEKKKSSELEKLRHEFKKSLQRS